LDPRLAEAQAGQRAVYFVDAAPFVWGAFLGVLWCFQRLFVKAPSGRQRVTVLAALSATPPELFTVKNLTYITAETVCEWLRLLAGAHSGIPIPVILDNARYQRCALVQRVALALGIELLYLPAYSPNLNLIERFWKFIKKQCLSSKYYAESASFQQAICECIEQAPTQHKAELDSLLTWQFQTFKAVPVVGENQKVYFFPVVKPSKKKVSAKAA
jgi:transposase